MISATLKWGRQSFSATESGYRWESAAGVREGPWSQVTAVMTMAIGVTVEGIGIGSWQHLGVTFEDGSSFRVESRDKDAFEVARLTVGYAGPHVARSVFQQLEAGRTVQFGPVALSHESIAVNGKTWPLSSFAGHRTAQGYWMMDVGPASAPRLVAAVMLNKLPNHFALRAALTRLAPGKEYPEHGPDLGTTMRPSASSHDPRSMTGRSRVLVLGGIAAAALVFGAGGWLAYNANIEAQARRRQEAEERKAAQVAKFAETAKGLAIAEAPWACAALPKDAGEVLYYVETPAGVEHPLAGKPYAYRDRPSEIAPGDSSTLALVARVKAYGKLADADLHELKAGLALVETASGQVKCSGQLATGVESSAAAERLLADALASAVCAPSGGGLYCSRPLSKVKPLPPPKAEPRPELKEALRPEPAPWAKGTKVEVQRKGKWLPAVVVRPIKTGFRVHYEGKSARQDENVPVARLRAR